MVRTLSFHCRRNRIQSLAGELSSHKPSGAAKKKKKRMVCMLHSVFFMFSFLNKGREAALALGVDQSSLFSLLFETPTEIKLVLNLNSF